MLGEVGGLFCDVRICIGERVSVGGADGVVGLRMWGLIDSTLCKYWIPRFVGIRSLRVEILSLNKNPKKKG